MIFFYITLGFIWKNTRSNKLSCGNRDNLQILFVLNSNDSYGFKHICIGLKKNSYLYNVINFIIYQMWDITILIKL